MSPSSAEAMSALEADIAQIARDLPGRLGLLVRFIDDDLEVGYAADEVFPAASVIKIQIMVEAYRQVEAGRLALDEDLPVLQEEMTGGSGVLQHLHAGLRLTVADALELMIVVSDNTATNLVLRRIGTESVNRTMQELGYPNSWSAGPIGRGAKKLSQTTPRETAGLLTRMARRTLLSESSCEAMLRTLEHQLYDDMIPRFLPIIPYPDRLGLPEMPVRVAHKTGGLSGIRNDAGVIVVRHPGPERTIVVSAFTADVDDHDLWTPQNIGVVAIAKIAKSSYDTQLRLTGRGS